MTGIANYKNEHNFHINKLLYQEDKYDVNSWQRINPIDFTGTQTSAWYIMLFLPN